MSAGLDAVTYSPQLTSGSQVAATAPANVQDFGATPTVTPSYVDPNQNNQYLAYYCLRGDTKIALTNGTSPTIASLATAFANTGEPFWVYSFDVENSRIVPGLATAVLLSGRKRCVEVEIDNDEVVVCSFDHPFLTRDGSYVCAENLEPGQSLMPLYRRARVAKARAAKTARYEALCATTVNHKVRAIRPAGDFEVYDLTVEKWHNFALQAGVFVHNTQLQQQATAPTYAAQQQTLQDQAAARGLTGGAAQYGETQLLGEQAAATAGALQPLVSQGYGYTQQDILSNQEAGNTANATNAAYYDQAVTGNASSYNNYLATLGSEGSGYGNSLLSAYLNSYGPNTGIQSLEQTGEGSELSAYGNAYDQGIQGQGQTLGSLGQAGGAVFGDLLEAGAIA